MNTKKEQSHFYKYDCKFFNGFKPCHQQSHCENCPDYQAQKPFCLIINYDALGDVLRTSLVTETLAKKFSIIYLTSARAKELLLGNPFIHKILTDEDERIFLNTFFRLVINFDKSLHAGLLLNQIQAEEKKGFYVDQNHKIRFLGESFEELYVQGLHDDLKFHGNQKTMNELLVEAVEEKWNGQRYHLYLTEEEKKEMLARSLAWRKVDAPVVGINVGCSLKYPYKKLDLEVLESLSKNLVKDFNVVLLGGLEDQERFSYLSHIEGVQVSPRENGLRDGALSIGACDLMVTGDTLGLHLAIALQKKILVWFGPSCAQEIELYSLGEKILAPVDCGPCWKQSCDKLVKCNQLIDPKLLAQKVRQLLEYSRPRSLAI